MYTSACFCSFIIPMQFIDYNYRVAQKKSPKQNGILPTACGCNNWYQQLGTFSVNCEWACGRLFAVSGEIRTHRSRTRSAESARPLRVILDSVVIIKCEIQCSYKRVI